MPRGQFHRGISSSEDLSRCVKLVSHWQKEKKRKKKKKKKKIQTKQLISALQQRTSTEPEFLEYLGVLAESLNSTTGKEMWWGDYKVRQASLGVLERPCV